MSEPALAGLRPVALLELLADEALLRRHRHELELRQRRRRFVRLAEPRPDDVPGLRDVQGANTRLRHQPRRHVRRCVGNVYARAFGGELPAVIGAAQPAALVAAKEEVGAPVRAARLDDADAAVRVAKGHEVLAQELHANRIAVRRRQLSRQQRRQPIAPERGAHWGSRARIRERLVLLQCQHRSLPSACRLHLGANGGLAQPAHATPGVNRR